MVSVIDRSAGSPAFDAHLAAVARTLTWAEESAARGDHSDALAWMSVLEAIGEDLSGEYATKRRAWRRALAAQRLGNSIRPTS
jgi:hypothetical protein